MSGTVTARAPAPLVARYGLDDLCLLEPEERRRFVPEGAPVAETLASVAWELLYRKEPELYVRLTRGEAIHPGVLDALPAGGRCVELAAGAGRLTEWLHGRFVHLVAIEPAAALREVLSERLPGVDVRPGFFDDTGLEDACADLVVSCSAFTADDAHGGGTGLRELERIAAPGATIAFVWPSDVDWLVERGFSYATFPGDMAVTFDSVDEAVELARIFYPRASDEIERRGSAEVPYEILGMNPPRDLAWKRLS